jgi:hypothetical protein
MGDPVPHSQGSTVQPRDVTRVYAESLPRTALWTAIAGVAISFLYYALEEAAIRAEWIERVVYATRERAWFNPPLLGACVFLVFAALPAIVLAALRREVVACGGSDASRPGAHEARVPRALTRWARWDAAALVFWILYPTVHLLPRLRGIASCAPEFLLSKMRSEGFDFQNRLAAYGMGFFFLALLLWKAGIFFRFLLEVSAESWGAARKGFLGLCAAVYVFTAFWTTAEYPPTGDEPHYLLMAHSIVLDHDLWLENNYANRDYLLFRSRLEPQIPLTNSGSVTRHEAAFALLIAPAYALAGRIGVVLFLSVIATLALWQLVQILDDLLGEPGAALKATAAIGFLTPFYIYSSQVFPEMAGALVLTVTLRLALSCRMEKWYGLPMLCLCLALLPLLKARFVFIALGVFMLALFNHQHRIRHLLLLPFLLWPPMFLLLLSLFWMDTVGSGGYAYAGRFLTFLDQITSPPAAPAYPSSILAPLFDQGSGLVVYGPSLLLAFAGIVPLWRNNGTRALLFLQLLLWYYLVKGPYWHAGWCPPGRYLICVLPVAAIFLGYGLRARNTLGTVLARMLAVLSGLILFALTVLPPLRYPVLPNGDSALLTLLTKATRIPFTSLVPNCSDPSRTQASAWVVPFFLVAVSFFAGAWGERSDSAPRSRRPL